MERKQYLIQVTPTLLKKLKRYWNLYLLAEDEYWKERKRLEETMFAETGLELEFFNVDGECVGIGEATREMRLVHREELE